MNDNPHFQSDNLRYSRLSQDEEQQLATAIQSLPIRNPNIDYGREVQSSDASDKYSWPVRLSLIVLASTATWAGVIAGGGAIVRLLHG